MTRSKLPASGIELNGCEQTFMAHLDISASVVERIARSGHNRDITSSVE